MMKFSMLQSYYNFKAPKPKTRIRPKVCLTRLTTPVVTAEDPKCIVSYKPDFSLAEATEVRLCIWKIIQRFKSLSTGIYYF